MVDRHAWTKRPALPKAVPAGLVEVDGYRLPVSSRATFHRDELVEMARANGHRLTPGMMKWWRRWELIPAPTPGGATGKGPGKGQRWSQAAALRVAWISRWVSAGLPYSAVIVALVPFTPDLERQAPKHLHEALVKFVEWDRQYQEGVLSRAFRGDDYSSPIFGAYEEVIHEASRDPEAIATLLRDAGVENDTEEWTRASELLEYLNFDSLRAAVSRADADRLVRFGDQLRAWVFDDLGRAELFKGMAEQTALGLARIVIRNLFQFMLREEGALKTSGIS